MVARNPAQLAVSETPAATVTVSLVLPLPPVQYMVKGQTPAATVCRGRLVNPQVDVTPPAAVWMAQAVVCVPIVWSSVLATHAGEVPLPCRYSGLPAASTTGARDESHASPLNVTRSATMTAQPTHRPRAPAVWRFTIGDKGRAAPLESWRRALGPRSQRRRRLSRRR